MAAPTNDQPESRVADRTAFEQALAGSAPTTIAGVVERLQAIDDALPPGDGVSWFAKLYLEVTKSVGAAVVPGSFRDPEFVEQLDVAFAELFGDATVAAQAAGDAEGVVSATGGAVASRHRADPVRSGGDERAHQPRPPGGTGCGL